jgi:competence protein ComGC
MKYRKTVILVCIVCVAMLISILSLAFFQAWSEQARDTHVYTVVHLLALDIRAFLANEGRYPKSLDELKSANYLSDAEKRSIQELVGTTQQNNWHDIYSYTLLTNGFSIDVRSAEPVAAHWFGKPLKTLRYSEIDGKTIGFDSP